MIKAGYDPSKVNFIPNFTAFDDPPEQKRLPEKAQFLFLGRLEPSKGVAWLLRSFSLMSNEVILNIAGSGADEPHLRDLACELGLERRVNFLGWVSNDRRLRLLREATALVVPSTWHETFGLVVIEAAAQGCAVIASDAGELPFLVEDGKTGLVVPVGHLTALTTALDDLAGNKSKALQMGEVNRQVCGQKYNPASHMEKINQVYRLAIEAGSERST